MFDEAFVIEKSMKQKLPVSMFVYRFYAREVSSGLYRVFDIPVSAVDDFLRAYFLNGTPDGFVLEIEGLHMVDL